jgi:hypothetical protein
MTARAALAAAAGALIAVALPADGRAQPSSEAGLDTVPEYVTKALSLYEPAPSVFDVRELVARWEDDGGLVTAADSLLAARMWRRALETGEALAWLPAPATTGDSGQTGREPLESLVHLERARILLPGSAAGRASRLGAERLQIRGASDFRVACESGAPEVERELWLDLRSLFTPAEREAWDAALPGEKCDVVRLAIDDRAVRSAMSADERLAVHYSRLRAARTRYGISRPRFMKTASDYRGRPDSLEVDDRGYMLIRLGEPSEIFFATRPVERNSLLGIEEDWVYERTGGVWLFHFVPCDTNRPEPCMPRSGHSLAESFGPLAIPGTFFFQNFVTRLTIDPVPLKRMIFTYGAADALQANLNAAEARIYLRQARMMARELHTRAITEAPDVPELMPVVDVAFEILRFWNPGVGNAAVWFMGTSRADQLEARRTSRGGSLRSTVLTVAIRGPDGTTVRDVKREFETPEPLREGAGLDAFLRTSLAPGPWPVTIALRDANLVEPVGSWLQDTLIVPDFGGAYGSVLPALSDIAVAPDSGGAWTRDGRIFLPITAAHSTRPDGTVHVYFEVYGMRPGAAYEVELRLVEEANADRIWRLDSDDLAFRLVFSSEQSDDGSGIGRHHLRLDFSDTRDGSYLLGVQVKKSETGERSLPVVTPIAVLGEG